MDWRAACVLPNTLMTDTNLPLSKQCAYCKQYKPLTEFRRRTGKRSKGQSRRGACRECRKLREAGNAQMQLQVKGAPAFKEAKTPHTSTGSKGKTCPRAADPRRKAPQLRGPKPDPQDASALVPSAKGMILMRGHSDKGRRWHQEIDLELAVTLVKEHAALVVNRRTIRRLYSNKDFRAYILTRDNYTCHFCGLYGDTIDHLLPRAKGGHTTPDNCVCACNLCNQTKADQYVEEFMGR
ncbi:HNH endonuclease [Paenibacillus jilunlii]|uniref:HNH endonuclease n=2 Tax=Paenibacillus jilunlii TaxID=682956 RepID=A0A1G9IKG3_9BACL|nr:HNH endonuclease [Paenibacillus jilunlii]SDL25739.1 HNH endonuclease [Paenibacillus jilunlii]